jgi:prepilin-type processing-associated H-X9-DG protein
VNDIRGGYGVSFYSGNHGNERLPGSADTPQQANGVFYWNSSIHLAEIVDGSSNTLMVGERGLDSALGIWPGVRANQHENDAVTDCSDHARINSDITSFSSLHGEGANFLFCDGAVRFISQTIDSQPAGTPGLGTYQRLAQRDDGNPVGDF